MTVLGAARLLDDLVWSCQADDWEGAARMHDDWISLIF